MKFLKTGFVFLLLFAFCSQKQADTGGMNSLSEKEKAKGWVLLFDGTTSDGWRGYNKETFPEYGWEIADGTLHCLGEDHYKGKRGGDIITVGEYGNFELKLEWKIAEGGNSGIFYRAAEKQKDGIWKTSPEMQVLDNERHPDAKKGKDGNRKAGALYDLIPAVPQNAKPAGEWNQVKIVCNGPHVEHWQNGVKVLEYELWSDRWNELVAQSKFAQLPEFGTFKKGHIGLQDHSNDVRYRNIKIKILQ